MVFVIFLDCESPNAPTDGTVNVTLTTYNQQAEYSCNPGYTLNGTAATTCGKGTWSGSLPTCDGIDTYYYYSNQQPVCLRAVWVLNGLHSLI